MDLGVPIPTIDAAVAMRNLSALESERTAASSALPRPARRFGGDRGAFLQQIGRALFAGTIIVYAQGLAVLKAASEKYGYGLDLSAVARIWRGGCIIRAAALEDIRRAYHDQPALANLLLDPELAKKVTAHQEDLRAVVGAAAQLGLPAPGLMTALGYLDGYRSAWLPANLIQAQRDYFGAHTYERIDAEGSFHTQWETA
jgi:6-phosphogluconate dehydrogenase